MGIRHLMHKVVGWKRDPFRNRPNWAEFVTIILTIGFLVVGGFQLRVYRQQKAIMQQQKDIMDSGSGQTDKLISAANLQVCAANKLVDASQRNAAAAESFATQAKNQASKMADLALQAKRQSEISRKTLSLSQRAYVTIGRKDGIIADFIVPKDPKQNAEIVIFFQNTGHLPAKFAWGTMAGFLTSESNTSHSGMVWSHPYHGGLAPKTRDKKTGSIGESGESQIIAGDSTLITTLATISQTDLAKLPQNISGEIIFGFYEYCDEVGNRVSKQFSLRYRPNAPVSALSFDLANESDGFPFHMPKDTDTTEYLSPCASPK